MSQRSGLSDRAIQKHLSDLVSKGVVKIERSGGGRHCVNFYRITPEKGEPDSGNGVHRIDQKGAPRSEKGERRSSKGCTTFTPTEEGTVQEQKNGQSKPKSTWELEVQIKRATEEITRLRDFGKCEADRLRMVELIQKRKAWKQEVLDR